MSQPDLEALLRQNLTLTGDGNIVGNDDTVTVIKQSAGDYAIQIGELRLTLSPDELYRILAPAPVTISGSQVGVVGDHAHIEGGIHFHDSPPYKALSLYQLPSPPDDFTGREAELAELRAALETKGATISSLRGMGGVGKTVLALKLAEELTPRYPDAQFYLDLQGTTQPLTPDQAMAHVIRAYHPTARLPESEAELGGLYRTVLHNQRALLLMDNAAGRAQVESLIPPAGCVLLVTSRRHFTLPGLQAVNLDAMPLGDARELLLKIAERIGDEAEEMAELCGCLPLALRLVGSVLAERVDLSPADYLRRLRDTQTRLGLIDASLSLSYELLETELQRLWVMLAVFPGTFDKGAAGTVWALDSDAARDALGELLKYSLVGWDPAVSRYHLHDLARLFADARLGEAERALAGRRHSAYYLLVVYVANELYRKGGEALEGGLELLDREWSNIQAGQAWAGTYAERDDTAARLCSTYLDAGMYCFQLRQHPQDQIHWLEAAVVAARRLKDYRSEGRHLGNLGIAYRLLGQVERAIEYFEQALAIAHETGDRRGEGTSSGNLGVACHDLRQVERAIEYLEQALAIARETGDRRGEAYYSSNLGNAYSTAGQVERAIEYFEQALAIAREIGDFLAEGAVLGNLGAAYQVLRQVERAIEYHQQALAISRKIGDRRGEGIRLHNIGILYKGRGNVALARQYLQQALAIFEETKSPHAEQARRWLAELD